MVSGQRLFQSHLNRRGSRHLQQILLHQQIRLQYRRNPVNGLLEEVHIQPYSRYHTDRRGHRNKVVHIHQCFYSGRREMLNGRKSVKQSGIMECIREVVKRLGFQNICLSENIVADRARFAEIYQAIQRRKRTEMNIGSALPNLREMVQMRLAELTQRGQKAIDQEKDKN